MIFSANHIFDVLMLLAMALAALRIVRGPTTADRMVALDMIGITFGIICAAQALKSGEESALDIVLVFALVTFFGTVAVARHVQRQAEKMPTQEDNL